MFAAALFRMYTRYSALRGWKFEVMDINETGLGGYKEATATITGRNVFAADGLEFRAGQQPFIDAFVDGDMSVFDDVCAALA